MKKVLALILALVMCLPLCACSSGIEYAVTFADGTTENLTVDDIADVHINDVLTWDKKYVGAKIIGEGKITNIMKDAGFAASDDTYIVWINDEITLDAQSANLDGMNVGSRVRFEGKIIQGVGNVPVGSARLIPLG